MAQTQLTPPTAPPQDILCVSSIDWDFNWQGHQEIMSTLAARGHRVLFIENTGVRNPSFRDLGRIRHRFDRWRKSLKGFRQEGKNLYILSPLVLPFPYWRLARWINRWLLTSALRNWMLAMEFHLPVCWTFLPTPLILEVLRRTPHQALVYYCIDSFPDSTPAAHRIVPSEEALFREADLVFVTSQSLFERASQFNRNVHLFPFGVDFEGFEQAQALSDGVPADLKGIPHPRIGYVGGIHQWVDQELLIQTARQCRQYHFVLIGPPQGNVERLKKEPNILLLGPRSHEQLPHYIQHFDAGIIPYRLSDYTQNVYPTKLNEYHALGIPVVSTPLPEVLSFNQRHPDLVRVGGTAEEFSDALRRALGDSSAALQATRVESARINRWSLKIDQMLQLIHRVVIEKQTSHPNNWTARFRAVWARPRWALRGSILAVTGLVLATFQTPLVWFLAEPLRVQNKIQPADAIVLFAGGVGESGQAGESYQERVKQAAWLYHAGYASTVMLLSGDAWTFDEVDVMRALAKELKVPSRAIVTERRVSNTFDYVTQVEAMAQARGWNSILLVTSPYHSMRALLTFKKNAPRLSVLHASGSTSSYYARSGWGIRLRQLRGLLHEAMGILFYWCKGWI